MARLKKRLAENKRQKNFNRYFIWPFRLFAFTLAIGTIAALITVAALGLFSPMGLAFGAIGTVVGFALPTTGAMVMTMNVSFAFMAGLLLFQAASLLIRAPVNWLFNKYDAYQTAKEQIRKPSLVPPEEENDYLGDDELQDKFLAGNSYVDPLRKIPVRKKPTSVNIEDHDFDDDNDFSLSKQEM